MPNSARIRYFAKPRTDGKRKTWGVYDRDRGSWPGSIPGFGEVAQHVATEAEAQQEADRLANCGGLPANVEPIRSGNDERG